MADYTLRGQIEPDNQPHRVILFDGKFTTGFRIKKFVISPYNIDNTNIRTYAAKLGTSNNLAVNVWNWGDNREVGWAWSTWDANNAQAPNQFEEVDNQTIIVEDLWIYVDEVAGGTNQFVNYIIEFEKVSIKDWEGALTLARDRSAGGD
jgi:hypothetical protein